MSYYFPTYVARSIFEIDIDFYKTQNIKYILADLDNTLDSYKSKIPTERTKEFVKMLDSYNIALVIISNNSEKRVSNYCNELKIKYLYKSGKPFIKKINNYLTENNIDKNECVFIGDQLSTDIKCAYKLGIKSVLTEEIAKENQLVTKINKFFAKGRLLRLKRDKILIDWRSYKWQN